jgi:hypothetical protein
MIYKNILEKYIIIQYSDLFYDFLLLNSGHISDLNTKKLEKDSTKNA